MFGKKKMTLDELKKAYAELSSEEQQSFNGSINTGDDNNSIGTAEKKDGEEPVNTVADNEVDDGVAVAPVEAIEPTIEPEPATVNEPVKTEEVNETAEQQEQEDERMSAITSRINALEESFAKAMETIQNLTSNAENKDFGLTPKPSGGNGEFTDDDRIMENYYKKAPRAYK